jgi:hypothetical protein
MFFLSLVKCWDSSFISVPMLPYRPLLWSPATSRSKKKEAIQLNLYHEACQTGPNSLFVLCFLDVAAELPGWVVVILPLSFTWGQQCTLRLSWQHDEVHLGLAKMWYILISKTEWRCCGRTAPINSNAVLPPIRADKWFGFCWDRVVFLSLLMISLSSCKPLHYNDKDTH